ncbi:2-carboxy-D-arabinitol-1-phosphatase-like [Raphidocelis subcapitata]|uniref:2-carboxy-D-arabinitol-1-phosphatase-like n=1 Tax=Raphidocelis subcapitata TaxID=307507 RepID=A0A2V0PQF9_9CHLO|nr:2-carboxy-D-arabinitol-1-phosphatase-like [Raphidocelis subcapitata]|eukprot:GBF99445.1 2-carboxy-D-arabinitol-1-phosphatase-like [Raphidocelis subcapitata]
MPAVPLGCHCRPGALSPAARRHRRLPLVAATAATPAKAAGEAAVGWRGSDAFTPLGDRVDAPPLSLPPITSRRRVVLVRHGQSTWNAEGRIQGSSDFSRLTAKGEAQAETARSMLEGESFSSLFVSPLARARQTADIVARGQGLEPRVLPALREIDLYSFQGLVKSEGKERFGEAFAAWQRDPSGFEIDGHAPVRELWHRGSAAWQHVLTEGGADAAEGRTPCALVVAHNAVNQALLGTALGLPPRFFRRLLQSNGATSVLDFEPPPCPGAPPRVTVDRLNQSPGSPFKTDDAGRPTASRVVIVRHAATEGSSDGLLLGSLDEPLSALGVVQAGKVAELMMGLQIDSLLTSPARRCASTAELIAGLQGARRFGGGPARPRSGLDRVLLLPELRNLDVGLWEGQPGALVRGTPLPDNAEDLGEFWARTDAAWQRVLTEAAPRSAIMGGGAAGGGGGGSGSGRTVVVVAHAAVAAALVCHCLGLGPEGLPLFRFAAGGVTVVDFPDGPAVPGGGVLRTLNHTAHLGQWAVPITPPDDGSEVCGIDGCF